MLAKPEVREAFQNDLSDPRHGTKNGYKNYECRCDRCGTAMRKQPSDKPYEKRRERQVSLYHQVEQGAFDFNRTPKTPVFVGTGKPSGLTFHKAPFDPEAARGRAADAVAVVTGPHKGARRTDGTEV